MGSPGAYPGYGARYFEEVYKGRYFLSNPPYKMRSYLREIRRLKRAGRLIDVGCGYGSFLEQARAHFDCTGCDVSEHAIATARERLPRCSLSVAEISNYHSSGRFDVVTCFDVLEHITDLDAALVKIRSLLADDGILVIVVPVYDRVIGWLARALDRDPTHVHKRDRAFWLRRLHDHGFRILVYKGIIRTPVAGCAYLHVMGRWWRGFSPAIFLIVSKTVGPETGSNLAMEMKYRVGDEWKKYWQARTSIPSWDYTSETVIEALRRECGPFMGKSVLEAGCEMGQISLEMALSGARVVSIDVSPEAVKHTRRIFTEASMPHRVSVASIFGLPF